MKLPSLLKLVITVSLIAASFTAQAHTTTSTMLGKFDTSKDLFLPQFDSKTDVDDIHSVAAVATMLSDPRFSEVNFHAVAGAYGTQEGLYVPANQLFDMGFGDNWSDAHENHKKALETVTALVITTLDEGGSIWIAEAGQSDFSAAVARQVKSQRPEFDLTKHFNVVQHSGWNQESTTPGDLEFVQTQTAYHKIEDGNFEGNGTPGFNTPSPDHWEAATTHAKAGPYWKEARSIGNKYNGVDDRYLNEAIKAGGIDFSDASETCWIFGFSDIVDAGEFFEVFKAAE